MGHMTTNDGARLRWASVLLSALTATAIGGGALAQEPTPQLGPSAPVDASVPSPFPTAEEVGAVLGVEVGIRGIEPGLSQLWEGIEFDWQELPSAYVGIYRAPPFETDEPLAGAIIDVAEFVTVDDAMRHADEKFADWPTGFETDLSGDHVFTHTFPSEDFDGSFIVLRDGSVVVVATVMTSNGTDTEAASEAMVELVLSKLRGEE
jgi:hypothetical protein